MASEKRRKNRIRTVWKKRIYSYITVKRIKGKACRRMKCVRITSAAAAATTKGLATATRGFSVNTFSTEKNAQPDNLSPCVDRRWGGRTRAFTTVYRTHYHRHRSRGICIGFIRVLYPNDYIIIMLDYTGAV